jgi:tyrosyl-tRNA synthetase
VLPGKAGLKKLMAKKKIRLYLGIDPTATNLHLGHTVMLRKLQQFADLGHEAILVFGTGTVLVGDPSERDTGRKLITEKEIMENIATWKDQVKTIVDFDKVKVKYNGDWLTKLSLKELVRIASNVSAVQLFKRDSFQRRLEEGDTVWYHETMYPLLQGYDSVAMDVDLELGGTDQTFNMLIGRELVKKMKGKEKYVLAGKMIMGTDGKSMSKTSGNCIWLIDTPEDIYGKIMGVRDELLTDYYEFFTDVDLGKLDLSDPLKAKKELAFTITDQLHGKEKAENAQKYFESTFQKKMPEFKESVAGQGSLAATISPLVGSNSQAKRLIDQKAVDVNGITATDFNQKVKTGDQLKVGKKIFVTLT